MKLRDAVLFLAIVLSTACTVEETRQWIVSSLIAGVDGVECRVLAGGCDGTEVLHTTTFCASGGAGAAPSGPVDGQRYGYYCRATDCCGGPVAEGCTEVVHPPAGDVRVVMDRELDAACEPCTSPCRSVVPQEDGGPSEEDGSPSTDAPTVDGVMGPTSCGSGLPDCPPGSVCVEGPAAGDGRCAVSCTPGSACGAGEECKWLPEGRACWYAGPRAPGDPCAMHDECGYEQACARVMRAGAVGVFCARVGCENNGDCIVGGPGEDQVCVPLEGTDFCLPGCTSTACPSPLLCGPLTGIEGLEAQVCAP